MRNVRFNTVLYRLEHSKIRTKERYIPPRLNECKQNNIHRAKSDYNSFGKGNKAGQYEAVDIAEANEPILISLIYKDFE